MASSATFTTIVIVVLAFVTYSEQRAFQRYSKYLEKAVPNHWHHDKEELGRRVDKISRWHQVERVPPLQPQEASWDRLAREGRVAAFDKNQDKEQQRVRRRLLEEKLKLNHISRKVMVHPQMKRQVEVKSVEKLRTKREILDEKSNKQLEIQPLEGIRHKRDIILNPQIQPEVMLQSHIQTPMQQETEAQYQERVKQNRDKRQIMYLMNQPPIFINLAPRTTPNPFIRETHVDEYQAIESNPPVKSDSYDDSSIMSDTSDIEFDSGYSLSMSDSEDWHNYPLTTPFRPNPGWQLSTLADIYQKGRRKHPPEHRPASRVSRHQQDLTMTRVKRSPKQKKRRIGAYKDNLKRRRKLKEIRQMRRIIRNSKEDKAVKEDIDGEKVEKLLQESVNKKRRLTYADRKNILWSNGTHIIEEDKDASFEWFNKTHYVVYTSKEKKGWYNKQHVLVYDRDYWRNKTLAERQVAETEVEHEPSVESYKAEYSEDYDEEFTREELEELEAEIKLNRERARRIDQEMETSIEKDRVKTTVTEPKVVQMAEERKKEIIKEISRVKAERASDELKVDKKDEKSKKSKKGKVKKSKSKEEVKETGKKSKKGKIKKSKSKEEDEVKETSKKSKKDKFKKSKSEEEEEVEVKETIKKSKKGKIKKSKSKEEEEVEVKETIKKSKKGKIKKSKSEEDEVKETSKKSKKGEIKQSKSKEEEEVKDSKLEKTTKKKDVIKKDEGMKKKDKGVDQTDKKKDGKEDEDKKDELGKTKGKKDKKGAGKRGKRKPKVTVKPKKKKKKTRKRIVDIPREETFFSSEESKEEVKVDTKIEGKKDYLRRIKKGQDKAKGKKGKRKP